MSLAKAQEWRIVSGGTAGGASLLYWLCFSKEIIQARSGSINSLIRRCVWIYCFGTSTSETFGEVFEHAYLSEKD